MSVSFQNEFLIRKQHPEGGLSRKVPPTYSFLSKYYRSSLSYKYSTTSNSYIISNFSCGGQVEGRRHFPVLGIRKHRLHLSSARFFTLRGILHIPCFPALLPLSRFTVTVQLKDRHHNARSCSIFSIH